jgi:hypothetical protein
MSVIWLMVIMLIANGLFTDLLVNLPLQLFQGVLAGLKLALLIAAIALGSWLIGDE